MSKAEERALEAYPIEICGYTVECRVGAKPEPQDWNEERRKCFQEGYEAAEKDLGWISVKDRLPDTTEYVFTCVEMQGRPQCVGFHFYKDGKWWEGYEEDTVGAVEYWMKIPELPITK